MCQTLSNKPKQSLLALFGENNIFQEMQQANYHKVREELLLRAGERSMMHWGQHTKGFKDREFALFSFQLWAYRCSFYYNALNYTCMLYVLCSMHNRVHNKKLYIKMIHLISSLWHPKYSFLAHLLRTCICHF